MSGARPRSSDAGPFRGIEAARHGSRHAAAGPPLRLTPGRSYKACQILVGARLGKPVSTVARAGAGASGMS